eukprot:3829379-Karenia_brevis.AAC.1
MAGLAATDIVDTSESGLTLYGSFPRRLLAEVNQAEALTPEHVMRPSEHRAWVPLWDRGEAAADRVPWMCEELGVPFNGGGDIALVKVRFTALGFGHYYLNGTLTTRDWKHWRFHGPLPLLRLNHLGEEMFRIDADVMGVVGPP